MSSFRVQTGAECFRAVLEELTQRGVFLCKKKINMPLCVLCSKFCARIKKEPGELSDAAKLQTPCEKLASQMHKHILIGVAEMT